jgi:hypothetical protein
VQAVYKSCSQLRAYVQAETLCTHNGALIRTRSICSNRYRRIAHPALDFSSHLGTAFRSLTTRASGAHWLYAAAAVEHLFTHMMSVTAAKVAGSANSGLALAEIDALRSEWISTGNVLVQNAAAQIITPLPSMPWAAGASKGGGGGRDGGGYNGGGRDGNRYGSGDRDRDGGGNRGKQRLPGDVPICRQFNTPAGCHFPACRYKHVVNEKREKTTK